MSKSKKSDLDAICERLVLINEQVDRELDSVLERYKLSPSDFFSLRHLINHRDRLEIEQAKEQVEKALPKTGVTWEELNLPSPDALTKDGVCLFKA
ncbi:MAG: hypothetical protein V1754_11045 [Pseudomonadota bacterium]